MARVSDNQARACTDGDRLTEFEAKLAQRLAVQRQEVLAGDRCLSGRNPNGIETEGERSCPRANFPSCPCG